MSNSFLDAGDPAPELSGPFRGSTAIDAGLVTRGVLRGPRHRRLFPDVYAPAELEVDLALRARAAGVLVAGRGVVAGYAAAELLGASSGPPDAPVDVIIASNYRCAGLRVRRERLDGHEAEMIGRTPVTSPVRTAFDLARWAPDLTERVAAVDALGFRRGVTAADVLSVRHRHLGTHGAGDVAEVLGLVDARAESPLESRVRVALVLGGLPPEVQYPAVLRGRRYRLDLAYPERRIAVEYDGEDHRTQRRARSDLIRGRAERGRLVGPAVRRRRGAVPARPHRRRRPGQARRVIGVCGLSRSSIAVRGHTRLSGQPPAPSTCHQSPPGPATGDHPASST